MTLNPRRLASTLYIVCGALAAGLGLKGFLLPSQFIDGGVTGISMLIAQLSGVPLALLLLLVNAPFVFIGWRQIGKDFAVKSLLAIAGLSVCLAVVPYPQVTTDNVLAAVFGGFFVGAGIGLAIRGGGVLDGTEVLAVLLSRRTFATVGDVIFGLNVLIFAFAAFFLGIETALYSMLTYFAASKTIDFLLHGVEEYNGVTIVSAHSESIRVALLTELRRGVTIFKGHGGYTDTEQQILFCVVTRLELQKLKSIVEAHDADAFVVMSAVNEISGGVVKHRAFH